MFAQAEQYGNRLSVVIFGFVCTTLADPKAIAMNRSFASSSRLRHLINIKKLDLEKLMGDLTLMFGCVVSPRCALLS